MHRLLLGLALVLLVAPPVVAAEEPRTVDGIVTRIRPDENTITVRENVTRRVRTYHADPDTRITFKGKESKLSRFMKGHQVTIRFRETDDGRFIVTRLAAPEPGEPTPDVAAAAPPEPAQLPAVLPSTASPMPLLALLGLASTAIGAGLTLRRRARR